MLLADPLGELEARLVAALLFLVVALEGASTLRCSDNAPAQRVLAHAPLARVVLRDGW